MHFIFDLDGTLIDSNPDIHQNINRLLREEGHPPLTMAQTESFVGNGSRKLVERAFTYYQALPDTNKTLDILTERFIAYYMANLTDQTTLYPNVMETLHKLKNAGHILSICTNKPLKPTKAILNVFDMEDLFDIVTAGDSYAERKPHPMPILETIKQTDIAAADTIMVGDSIYDIEAGKAANLRTILLTYGYTHGNVQDMHSDFVFKDFKKILDVI